MTLPRPEYPRPLIVRENWLNLNGTWAFTEDPDNQGLAEKWFSGQLPANTEIIVPFPVESEASGIGKPQPADVVWYQRKFELPDDWSDRIAIRIGASDYRTHVFVNGLEVGQHTGGYTPFSFDISHALQPGENSLTIRVEDSPSWTQPRGKQAGTTRWPIDYDSITGIWQTIWLEPLAEVSIESIHSQFSLASAELILSAQFSSHVDGVLTVRVMKDGNLIAEQSVDTQLRAEAKAILSIPDPELWSPESPELYDIELTLTNQAGTDSVRSYAGLRELTISEGKLCLNGEVLYLRGVLDQGYFPGGWYAATDDEQIHKDIELTLAMGFNCARKHQKAEDPRYLYWADRLGLMVWSEMPSGRIFSTGLVQTLTEQWMDLVNRDRGHPCVIAWVPLNESWGVWHQAERPEQRTFADALYHLTRSLDTSRPVIGNDGWEYSSGDIWTLHLYDNAEQISQKISGMMSHPGASVTGDLQRPRAGVLPDASTDGLPVILSECGGVGFGTYHQDEFSYGDIPTSESELEERIRETVRAILAQPALQGYVWTQLTDIQQEINGLLYFDRTPKLPLETFKEIFTSTPNDEPSQV